MRILIIIITTLSLISCGNPEHRSYIDYNVADGSDSLTIENLLADTTKMQVATLPVYFDSTTVLIQPSGFIYVSDTKKDLFSFDDNSYFNKSSTKKGNDDYEFNLGNIRNDNLTGKINNLYFDDIENNKQCFLTKKVIVIVNIFYLRQVYKNTGRQYLLYSVYDKDTNGDGKIDAKDLLSLYTSNLDGTDFSKITKENQEYVGGKLVPIANRYYFTTIEDINKDGRFNKEDKYYYYYIDFSLDQYKIIEYNPLKTI